MFGPARGLPEEKKQVENTHFQPKAKTGKGGGDVA